MNHPSPLSSQRQATVLGFLGLALFTPILFSLVPTSVILPAWPGAVIALSALFGALVVFWRSGALRLRYPLLLAGTVVLALVIGLLSN